MIHLPLHRHPRRQRRYESIVARSRTHEPSIDGACGSVDDEEKASKDFMQKVSRFRERTFTFDSFVQASRSTKRALTSAGKQSPKAIVSAASDVVQKSTLRMLARYRQSVLVSGTSGKTTATVMLLAALRTRGDVAYTRDETPGISQAVAALTRRRNAPYAVIGSDESSVGDIAEHLRPQVLVLLNIIHGNTNDPAYDDKFSEEIKRAIRLNPHMTIVANCDDPYVVAALLHARRVVWVSAGCSWKRDAVIFPKTGTQVIFQGDHWFVADSEYRRPQAQWKCENDRLISPAQGDSYEFALDVPSDTFTGYAAMCAVAAYYMGVGIPASLAAFNNAKKLVSRTLSYDIGGRHLHIFHVRNIPTFEQAVGLVANEDDDIIIAINEEEATCDAMSWMWDVDINIQPNSTPSSKGRRRERKIIVCGDYALELAVRFRYAGFSPILANSILDALNIVETGSHVDVIMNVSAAREAENLLTRFDSPHRLDLKKTYRKYSSRMQHSMQSQGFLAPVFDTPSPVHTCDGDFGKGE